MFFPAAAEGVSLPHASSARGIKIRSLRPIRPVVSKSVYGRSPPSPHFSSILPGSLMSMHEKILDNLQELVYIADMETYELLYYNRALAEEFHIPQGLRGKCHEILQGRQSPCPFCTNSNLSQDGCYVWKFYNPLVRRHFILSDSICEFNGRQVRTEIATDITEHMRLQEQLDRNLHL